MLEHRVSKLKVLVVDDSAIVRKVLSSSLLTHPAIETVDTAPDVFVAWRKIVTQSPDVLTLDIEMPGMDGLTFLRNLMSRRPMPVIVISSVTAKGGERALEALRYGAVEVLHKPGGPFSVADLKSELPAKLLAASRARFRAVAEKHVNPRPGRYEAFESSAVIAMGASTGGVRAIEQVLKEFPADCPGVVVVQHIPAVFSATFANRLDQVCAMKVKEAAHGDVLTSGMVLVAPGNRHLLLRKSRSGYYVELSDGPSICYQRPSVDVLFGSVAESAGTNGVGVLLTGMGADGAHGLLQMKQAGARTIAQDRESCVVFGMPKEAILRGAVEQVLPLADVPAALLAAAGSRAAAMRRILV
jgi:two-component system chemotaxis response regulator CheB